MPRSFIHNAFSLASLVALVLPAPAASTFTGGTHYKHQNRDAADAAHMNDLNKRAVPSYSGWSLTWADDFSGAANTLPSSSNWIFDLGTKYPNGPANWGTGEITSYTNSLNNVYVDGSSNLVIVPRRVSDTQWTSARLETKQTFGCAAGKKLKIEARIRLPTTDPGNQAGIWPAFWSMGKQFRDNGYDGWPGTGELDIMEAVNGQSQAYNTVHCDVYPNGACNEPNGISKNTAFSRSRFRVFSMIIDRTASTWQNEFLEWQIDGVQSFKVLGSTVGNSAAWAALTHKDIFVLLNVAVGGAFPNAVFGGPWTPNEWTSSGADSAMVVDYVAAYSWPAPPVTTTTTTRTTTRSTTTSTTTRTTTRSTTTTTTTTTTNTRTTTPATTTTTGTVTTPSPVQAGQAGNCVGWRYVQSSDTCANLVTRFSGIGLTLSRLVQWNPALGSTSNCTPTPGFFVCVQTSGTTTTTTTTTRSTTTSNPGTAATPSPVQPGQVSGCGGWRYVQASDTCANLVTRYASINLSLDNLVTWNPALGTTSNCRPTAGFFVCVKLAPPSPIQAGQVDGCEGWRYAQGSDTCANLVTRYASIGLTLNNLVRWNPALGTTSNCRVTPQFFVCVKV